MSDTDDIYHVCENCGDEYELRYGAEPTPFCDSCAHHQCSILTEQLQAAEATVKELRADIERMDQWQHNAKCLFKVVEDELVSATWQKLKSNDVKYTQLQIKTLINQL